MTTDDATTGREFGTTRRGVLGTLFAGGVAGASLTPIGEIIGRIAPPGGDIWQAIDGDRSTDGGNETVESPYGEATLTYDEYGSPHVEADTETAAYFAVGYAHGDDRLALMDLVRRQGKGTLAAVAGPFAADEDVFHRKLDLVAAAETSRRAIEDTRAEELLEAYAGGVNAAIDAGSSGIEFGLLGYEPSAWTVLDSILAMTVMARQLAGMFDSLRRAIVRDRFDEELVEELFPPAYDHGAPVIRRDGAGSDATSIDPRADRSMSDDRAVDSSLADWIAGFEPPETPGSNAWVVAGEHTDTGRPILAADPHLGLSAPPQVYEQHVTVEGFTTSGIAIPGVPFPIIGRNDYCAWGATNAGGVDVVDFYSYETDGDRYRYRGEWREFDRRTETVEVAFGDDREVTIEKTVHGAFLDPDVAGRDGALGVAWTGMGPTRELQALYELSTAGSFEAFRDGARKLDGLPLNLLYADREGNTAYLLGGKVPLREVDGEFVASDRIFDGSVGEAEWEDFVPFEELPSLRNPDYVASANQRTVDDPDYPLELPNAAGFRARRIYDRLDDAIEGDTPVDIEFTKALQLDTHNEQARLLVPAILDARDRYPPAAEPLVEALESWDYRMDRDSRAALVFRLFVRNFREIVWSDVFEGRGLNRRYWPSRWVLVTLPPDSPAFGGDRAVRFAEAMEETIAELEEHDWEVYGEFNVTRMDHPFGDILPGLNYDRIPTDGAFQTVRSYTPTGQFGAVYRLVVPFGEESTAVLPGGNDGHPTSPHYDDQLRMWADGGYRPLRSPTGDDPDVNFAEGDR